MDIVNKKAEFDFEILDKTEAGLVLTGDDIKNIRKGLISLNGSYAKIIGGSVYLIVSGLPSIKLLLHKKEILNFQNKIDAKKLTLVPTKLYTKRHLVKVELALAKPKKQFEKKESIKKRDLEREMARSTDY